MVTKVTLLLVRGGAEKHPSVPHRPGDHPGDSRQAAIGRAIVLEALLEDGDLVLDTAVLAGEDGADIGEAGITAVFICFRPRARASSASSGMTPQDDQTVFSGSAAGSSFSEP